MRLSRLPVAVCLLAVSAILFFLPPLAPDDPQTRHFTIDATQFAFTPSRMEVNRGDQVMLTLTASDVVHGFYLDGYGIEQRVEPGRSVQVMFVADRAGKYRYRCSVSCGSLHPFMIGELVVGPNTPFWRTAGLVLVALSGTLCYLWYSKGPSHDEIQQQT
mgnify:CR=1 FL=1